MQIKFSPLNLSLKNFYMADTISKHSKIMADCAILFNDNKNFL